MSRNQLMVPLSVFTSVRLREIWTPSPMISRRTTKKKERSSLCWAERRVTDVFVTPISPAFVFQRIYAQLWYKSYRYRADNYTVSLHPAQKNKPRPPQVHTSKINTGQKKPTKHFPPLCQHTHCRTFSPITLLLLILRWDHHGNRPERENRQLTGSSQHAWLLARSPPERAHTVTNEPQRAGAPIGWHLSGRRIRLKAHHHSCCS